MHDTTSKALSAFQITPRSPILPPSLLWPNLTQMKETMNHPQHQRKGWAFYQIVLQIKLSKTVTFNSVGNKILGNIIQSQVSPFGNGGKHGQGSIGKSCLKQDFRPDFFPLLKRKIAKDTNPMVELWPRLKWWWYTNDFIFRQKCQCTYK